MKLALFDAHRVGVVDAAADMIHDVSTLVPHRTAADDDAFGAGWWVRLCRDLPDLAPRLARNLRSCPQRSLNEVHLLPPVLNPSKVVACAANYEGHVAEMAEARRRAGRPPGAQSGKFDVFLKAPSSIIGPGAEVVLPGEPLEEGCEVHHEAELALIVGRLARRVDPDRAMDHVLGYTISLDMTVRGDGDRSRRKSYDTFTPLGPWLTTLDEVPDPHDLPVRLSVSGQVRHDDTTANLRVGIPGIIEYVSRVMTLYPGDVIQTGAAPGVGAVDAGDVIVASIGGLGELRVTVGEETTRQGATR